MTCNLRFIYRLLLITLFFGCPSFADEVGLGTYLCSLKIIRATSLVQPASYGKSPKVLVDLRDHPITLSEVAKNESDWKAYSEAFEGLSRTLQKTIHFPAFYTVRLLPDTRSGNQSLKLELSIQLYNKFMPSSMQPIAIEKGPTNSPVELVQFESLNRTRTEFSCRPAKS